MLFERGTWKEIPVAGKKIPTRRTSTSPTSAPKMRQVVERAQPRDSSAGSRAVIKRADGRTLRRVQVYFEESVAKKLRHHCVEHDIDVSSFVNDLVDKTLST
jgi:hypothetical protein